MSFKFRDLELLARQAGFDPSISPTIAAISLAESGGNPMAHNPRYPDNSYGLMQVNMLDEPGYRLGAERRQRYGLRSNDQLFDPLTNMKAAKDIYDSQGLGAWSVYTSGAYKNHLPGNYTPATELSASASQSSMPPAEQRQPSQQLGTDLGKSRMAGEITGSDGIFDVAIKNLSKLLGR